MALILSMAPGVKGLVVVTVAHGATGQLQISVPAAMAIHPNLSQLLDIMVEREDALINIRDRGMPQ